MYTNADRWPPPPDAKTGKRRGVVVAVAVLGLLLVGALAWALSSSSDADDAKSELAAVREQLDDVEERLDEERDRNEEEESEDSVATGDTGTVGNGTGPGEEEAAAELIEARAQLEATTEALAAEQAKVADLTDQVSTVQAEAAESQSALDAANTALTAVQADLEAAQAEGGRLAAPFAVDITTIRPPKKAFAVEGNVVSCVGYSSCDPAATMEGRFLEENGQLYFEWPFITKVPLATFDGFTWVGQAPASEAATTRCTGNDLPVPTTFTVTFAPTFYTVGAGDRSVVATTLHATWTRTAAAAHGCVDAASTYDGYFEF